MAEDPRFLLHFKTLAKFKEKLADGTVNENRHIVFIKDEKLFWCRGQYYSDFKKFAEISNINPNIVITELGKYNFELDLKSKEWDENTRSYKDKTNKHNFLSTNGVVLRKPTSSEGNQSIVFDFSTVDCADKVLVTPTINYTWTFAKQDGTSATSSVAGVTLTTTGSTNTSATIIPETGFKVNLVATFKWVHDDNKKDPTSTSGSLGTVLPSSNVNSETKTFNNITTSTTYKLTLTAPKKGFMIGSDDKTIVAATGNDNTSSQITVTFGHRHYYGVSTASTPNASIVLALSSTNVVTSKTLTVTEITASSSLYYMYAYPQALGALTRIVLDDATSITKAFKRTTVDVVNAAGATIPYYVYTSVNPGAFNNAKIIFS